MPHLIAKALEWIVRKLGLLAIIVGVLLAGSWLVSEWDRYSAIKREIEQQEALLASLREELRSIDDTLASDALEWRRTVQKMTAPLEAELRSLESRITQSTERSLEAQRRLSALARDSEAARAAARSARARFERLERGTWWWDKYLAPGKLLMLERARAKAVALEQAVKTAEAAERQAAIASAVLRWRTGELQARRSRLAQDIDLPARSVSPRYAALSESKARKRQEVDAVESILAAQHERAAQDPGQRFVTAIEEKLPIALAILAGILLAPALIKTILYFGVAPIVGRLAPIRILPDDAVPSIASPPPSAVSAVVEIAPGRELVVQPDFLQSSSQPARKRTKWFLNSRLPFASLASGMFALTAIVPEGETTTRVVVSSQKDVLGEVGLLEIPAGAAMVVHPRSLAGVVKSAAEPVRITRHWRLGSLHAWLTLQLRYLVFHGPCHLILKGCRGVRAEEPHPGQPRMINQAATLAFSANLDYRTTRSETFVPYLRGQAGLFDDLFAGGPGRFVYEEVPGSERKAGLTGRGLEGLTDAFLKAFGI